MRLNPDNKDRLSLTFDNWIEIPAIKTAVARNLGSVAGFAARTRLFATELNAAFTVAVSKKEEEPELTVSVPTDRLPSLEVDLAKRVNELTRLSTIRDSSDPDFFKAYGSPEYLARAKAAHTAISEYIHQPTLPPKNNIV